MSQNHDRESHSGPKYGCVCVCVYVTTLLISAIIIPRAMVIVLCGNTLTWHQNSFTPYDPVPSVFCSPLK